MRTSRKTLMPMLSGALAGGAVLVALAGCSPSGSSADYPFSFVVDDDCVVVRVRASVLRAAPQDVRDIAWLRLERKGKDQALLFINDLRSSTDEPGRAADTAPQLLRPHDPQVQKEGSSQYCGSVSTFEGSFEGTDASIDRVARLSYSCTVLYTPPWWAHGDDSRRNLWIEVSVEWRDEVGPDRLKGKGYLVFRWGPDGKPVVKSPAKGVVFEDDQAERPASAAGTSGVRSGT